MAPPTYVIDQARSLTPHEGKLGRSSRLGGNFNLGVAMSGRHSLTIPRRALGFGLRTILAGIAIALLAGCQGALAGDKPKLADVGEFQQMANRWKTGQLPRTCCACFDAPRLPRQITDPVEVVDKGRSLWDCPKGWVATCRIDHTLRKGPIQRTQGMHSFTWQNFSATGASSHNLFEMLSFRGELGPEQEGIPLGHLLPEWTGKRCYVD